MPVPAWYAEMLDHDYWLAQCQARAELLAVWIQAQREDKRASR